MIIDNANYKKNKYMQIYARQGCHNSRIWILHARCWNKLCTVMQQRANCLFASQSSILLTARSVNFTSSLQLTSSRVHCFFILSQVVFFGGLCWAWRARNMRDVSSCWKSAEKSITAFVDNTLPSGRLHNCLLAPHRGPVRLNSDIFFSVFVIQRFLGGNKGLSEPDSMVWILT